MKLLILAFAVTASYSAQAAVDGNCLNQCTSSGSNYQFCQQRCEYQPTYTGSNFGGGACMQQCRAAGASVPYCQFRCGN